MGGGDTQLARFLLYFVLFLSTSTQARSKHGQVLGTHALLRSLPSAVAALCAQLGLDTFDRAPLLS